MNITKRYEKWAKSATTEELKATLAYMDKVFAAEKNKLVRASYGTRKGIVESVLSARAIKNI